MHVNVPRTVKRLVVLSLAVLALAMVAYSGNIASIVLNENQFEKFGSLFFPFMFKVPQLFVLCDTGVDPHSRTG